MKCEVEENQNEARVKAVQLPKNSGHKNGKLLTSHRSTIYPCYLPVLGEFNRSWPYKTCRCKYKAVRLKPSIKVYFFDNKSSAIQIEGLLIEIVVGLLIPSAG